MSAACRRFGASASNLRSTRSGLPPAPFAGLVVTGVLPRRTALDAELAHDAQHLVAADRLRIPALRDQLGVRLAVPVHGHEEIRMDLRDVARQRLMPRPHAAGRS